MHSIVKGFVLFSLALSASALTTPHAARNVNHHRAIAAVAVAAVPEPVRPQGTLMARTIRRRSNSGRCKPKSSSSASSSTSKAGATPAANIEGAPPSAPKHSSSSDNPSSTMHASSSKHASPSKPTSSSGGNQPPFMTGSQVGEGTYYATGLTACGVTNNDNEHIAAVSHLLFDNYPGYDGGDPNSNPICGKKVTATYQGKSVQVIVTDRCTACKLTDLDFSPAAFSVIADQSVGRIFGMEWKWDS
jgi:hypothetical protein